MHRALPLWWIAAALLGSLLIAGCAFGGDDPPGCRTGHPEDCDDGWSCRAGVCVHPTTPLSPQDASVSEASADAGTEATADSSSE